MTIYGIILENRPDALPPLLYTSKESLEDRAKNVVHAARRSNLTCLEILLNHPRYLSHLPHSGHDSFGEVIWYVAGDACDHAEGLRRLLADSRAAAIPMHTTLQTASSCWKAIVKEAADKGNLNCLTHLKRHPHTRFIPIKGFEGLIEIYQSAHPRCKPLLKAWITERVKTA